MAETADSAETAESMYNLTNDPSGLVWVAHTGTDAVPNAVYAGKETNDREVYVARTLYGEGLLSGKFVPGWGMYLPYGDEVQLPTFQVLINPNDVQTKWALFEGKISPTAVKAGFLQDESVYIGRTKHSGNTVVGYVWPGDDNENHLFYSLNGREYLVEDFEILLAKNRHDYECVMNFQLNCCKSCPKKKQ